MAITAATRQDIIELCVIANDSAPGTTLLASLIAESESGKSLTQIAETLAARSEFTTKYPSIQTATEFATEFLETLLPEVGATFIAAGIPLVEAHINGGGSIGALIAICQDVLSTTASTDADLGTSVSNFNNKYTVAAYHTVTLELADGSSSVMTGVTSTASTVTTAKAAADLVKTPATVAAAVATHALTSDVSAVDEGGDIVFTLTTTNVAAGTEYSYVISGVGSADLSTGSLTGTASVDSDGKALVSVGLKADTTTEGAETLKLTVAGESASVTINDTSTTAAVAAATTYTLTAAASSVSEGDSGQTNLIFNLELDKAAEAAVVVNYETATSGTATAGTDFDSGSGSVTFAAGQTNASVTVKVNGDTTVESDETVAVTFSGSSLVASVTASGTVTNDDTATTASALTLDLTTAGNTLTGAATDDYVDGSLDSTNQTLTSSDVVDGGAGTDTLFAEISGTGTYTPTITNVEVMQGLFSAAGSISLLKSSGVTTFENLDSSAAVSFTNIPSAAGVTLKGSNSAQNVTLGFTAAAGVGTSDSIDVELSNVTGGTYSLALIETVNVESNDTANSIVLSGSKITTVNVTGAQNMTLGSLPSAVATLDASALTGVLSATVTKTLGATVTGTAGKDTIGGGAGPDTLVGGDGNDSITGGGGNDSIDAGAGTDTIVMASGLNAYDVVDGGDGTDTLSVTAAVTTASQVTNVEKLTSSLVGANQDMDPFSATTITDITSSGTSGTVGYTDIGTGITQYNITGAAPTTVTLTFKATDGLADASPIINLGIAASNITVTNLSVTTYETVTINSSNAAGVAASYTNTFTNIDNDVATTMNLTGSRPLVITSSDSTVLATLDASAMTGAFTLTANASAVAGTYTTGSGNDNIVGSTTHDSITTNAGNDTISGGGGNDTITGGTGNDSITGGSGKDSIIGGDGNDIIEDGGGIDNISGGAGNDTIKFDTTADLTGGTALVRDVVDGGDGTDTVSITTVVAITPYLTSIEHVDANITGGVALNLTNATSLTTIDVESDSHSSATITGLASGVEVNLKSDDAADTIDTVADASLTLDINIAHTDSGFTITDAASVTLKTSNTGTTGEDFVAVALDNTDTTSLTITGGTDDDAHIDTGNITLSDALTTLTVTSSTSGAPVVMGDIEDADSLTSITATGSYGAITTGEVGGTGTAEELATITASASYDSVVTFGAIVADTTNSTTENDLTITATTDDYTSSQIVFGAVTNTQGNITINASGGGDLDTGALTGVDVTYTSSAGAATDTSTIDDIIASDDIVITTSGAGIHIITDISGSDDVTITHTGTGAFTVSGISDGVDDITIDASGSTGAFTISANSDTGSTSNMTATGGTGKDTFLGAAGKDTLTGGAGNDTLTGGGGNDSLVGGDGNDTLTAGTGIDNLSGGAGNDSLVFAANFASTDTVDGGDGTDTLSITVNTTTGTIAATQVTNVEKTAILFATATGGAYSGGAGATTHTVTATAASTEIILTNIATGSTVNVSGDDDIASVYLDTAAGATVILGLGDDQTDATGDGDITILDAADVTLQGVTVTGIYDAVVLDNTDTTALTVRSTGTKGLTVGAVTNSAAVTSLTSTTASTGDVVMGTMVTATALTSLTLTGVAGDITTSTIGTDNSTLAASSLATINVSSTGGATVTTGTIYMDMISTTAGDLASTVNITVGTSSTGTLGAFDNEFGVTTATIANDGTIGSVSFLNEASGGGFVGTVTGDGSTTITAITAGTGDLVLTSSGIGARIFSNLDSTDNATVTLSGSGANVITELDVSDNATIDVSGMTGTITIDASDVEDTLTITGSAEVGFTSLTLMEATQQATVTLGVNGVTDHFITGASLTTATLSISNFKAGAAASGGDTIDLDVSGLEVWGTDMDIVLPGAMGTSAATNTHVLTELSAGAYDLSAVTSGTTILVLDADFATSGMVETALEASGSHALTLASAFVALDAFLVAYDDGTNSYLARASNVSGATRADNATLTAGDLSVDVLITFVGIADVGTLLAANFGTAYI